MSDQSDGSEQPDNRFVRLRCPLCAHVSPTCDQKHDVARSLLQRWWETHLKDHRPTPIIERGEPSLDPWRADDA
jgi:hypothetical protein